MNKKPIIFCLALLALGWGAHALAQYTPEEVAQMAQWEDFLKTAEVIGQRQLSGSEAVTNPWELTLKKGDITRNALWKNVTGRPKGFIDSWKYEIAAYEMDKLLGLDMVPPTVERRFREDRGSCQIWEESEMSLKTKTEKNIKTPPIKIMHWNRCTYLQRAFDNLIANEDRHMNNLLITKDWRIYLIDHSRSFRKSKEFTTKLLYTEKGKEGSKEMKELPKAFVERIKALNFEMIKKAVGEYLTDDEINAVLARQVLMLAEIDRICKKYGEENVLY